LAWLAFSDEQLAALACHNTPIVSVVTRQPDFTGVRIKVERAKHHFSDLQTRHERFQENQPYRFVRNDEPDTGDLVYRVEVLDQPRFSWWSAIAGDCVHNLRSSLDLLVCEMVRAEGNLVKKHTGFPVFRSAEAYANALKSGETRKVDGAPKCAVDLIMKSEPYEGSDNPFGMLHQLDIADKHRLLMTVGVAHEGTINTYTMADVLDAYPGQTTFNLFELPSAESLGFVVPKLAFPLEDGTEIYRIPAHRRTDPRAQMHMNPQFRFEVAVGEVELVEGKPLIPTLHQLIQFADGFIELCPPLFSNRGSTS
jgi:hypothetical protein